MRIIRAVRFGAKLRPLGFKLEAKTAKPLVEPGAAACKDVPQSRLFDEMLKLLLTGHATATIEQLKKKTGAGQGHHQWLELVVERADHPVGAGRWPITDRRVGEGKTLRAQLFAGLCAVARRQTGWDSA